MMNGVSMELQDVQEIKEEESIEEPVKSDFLYRFIKRTFDILLSIIGLLLFIPICLFVKMGYIFTKDFSPILFAQSRIGKNGKEFKFYKFRTMIPNADEALFELLKKDKKLAKEYKVNKKLKNDPRITKVGKILRKTSLDELPQVINVFLGQMSIIGNRPYLLVKKKIWVNIIMILLKQNLEFLVTGK